MSRSASIFRRHFQRQKGVIVSGKTRKIDLLFYVNAVNEFIRRDSDNPTIGLLICKDMDRTEVQLAFQGIMTPMGVATYANVKIQEIQEYLPTAEQIEIAEERWSRRRVIQFRGYVSSYHRHL